MITRYICLLALLVLGTAVPTQAADLKSIPDSLYPGLEYLLTIPKSNSDIEADQLTEIISFVASSAAESSMSMQDREKASAPTIMPTIQPVTGILINNTNIRARPSKGGSERLGGLFYNQAVKVIGRNDRANWFWIIYEDAPNGTAWILGASS